MTSWWSPLYAALTVRVLVGASSAPADDWPQWRGPNRDGAWNETVLMEAFPAGGLAVSWRRPVGRGWSSQVIADGRVHVTDVELAGAGAKERVLAFDAGSASATGLCESTRLCAERQGTGVRLPGCYPLIRPPAIAILGSIIPVPV